MPALLRNIGNALRYLVKLPPLAEDREEPERSPVEGKKNTPDPKDDRFPPGWRKRLGSGGPESPSKRQKTAGEELPVVIVEDVDGEIYEEDIDLDDEDDVEPSIEEDVYPTTEEAAEEYISDGEAEDPSGMDDEVEQNDEDITGAEAILLSSSSEDGIQSDDEEEIEDQEPTVIETLLESPTKERMNAPKDDTTVLPTKEFPDPDDFSFKYDAARKKRDEEAEAMRAGGWTEGAIELYRALSLRGYEPLLPHNWAKDFDTMPTPLFAIDDEVPFIESESGEDFRAIQALRKLVRLGPRVRDAVLTSASSPPPAHRRPEGLIQRGIEDYSKWALKDGNLNHRHNLPVMTTVAGPLTASAWELEATLKRQLDNLWEQWVAALAVRKEQESPDSQGSFDPPSEPDLIAPLPTLYGVLVSNTLIAFVAYERSYANYAFRTVATFNFREMDYDVWTSLAIAILVIHCRCDMALMEDSLVAANSPAFKEDDPDR